MTAATTTTVVKKSTKKKNNNVWTKPASRKGIEWLEPLEGLWKVLGILKLRLSSWVRRASETWVVDGEGDLQAPLGYDANSFGYRDIDGCKIHKALRRSMGRKGMWKVMLLGFTLICRRNLYAPKAPHLVWYKGQRYVYATDGKEDPPKVVPGNPLASITMRPTLKVVKEQDTEVLEAADIAS
ncbi:Protein TRAUCO [Camellia lanceoleosa]|uniref:Protein TRAUCO n=1 Tax=Camellia lanceoleosa TaxID=1840588 RepID=A0ACC0FND8_9ERIC|nr:Protein TRAUCO [Camellia lanceoleosa]